MQCCVPLCGNTSDNGSSSVRTGITFHELPRDQNLCAAWLRALGTPELHLPDPAVVCSQHMLDDNCVRELHSDTIPSTVQMCMICLDTDSKLCVMSRHKLQETYEQLTGLSLFQMCCLANLKQTLCVLCAQRLINFSRFRDLSLRAHSLMTDLVEQHGYMTIQHIELANNATEHLKCNLTQTTLATNHCDLYIDHTDEEEQTAAEESAAGDVAAAVVKNEDNSDSISKADNLELAQADDSHIDNPNNDCVSDDEYSDMSIKLESRLLDEAIGEALHSKVSKHAAEAESSVKSESVIFGCTFCFEDFVQEDDYNEHMSMHLQVRERGECCLGLCSEFFSQPRDGPDTLTVNPWNAKIIVSCPIEPVAPVCASAANKDNKAQATDTAATFSCDLCHYKCAYKSMFLQHKRVHSGEKPYSCDECNYRCARKSHLIYHKRIHTGEKPYSCDTCDYKCADQSCLLRHLRTHTGEKPYSCQMCNYKCTQKGSLLAHLRTHTGKPSHFKRPKETDEKLYCCEMCSYKSAIRGHYVKHVRVHTGEKPYACEICSYRCADRSCLVRHVRTHTGVKPYSCELCSYKCAQKGSLLAHKRTHSDEGPFSCELGSHKCATRSSLLKHMMVHSDEKPQE